MVSEIKIARRSERFQSLSLYLQSLHRNLQLSLGLAIFQNFECLVQLLVGLILWLLLFILVGYRGALIFVREAAIVIRYVRDHYVRGNSRILN